MGRAIDQEEFFVLRTGGFRERIFSHIERIRFCTSNHQQGFIDEIDMVRYVKAHQIQKTAGGVFKRGVRVRVGFPVVLVALAIQGKR
jgi:hypothetical protein